MIVIATGISGCGKVRELGGGPGHLVRLVDDAERWIESAQLEGRWTSPIKHLRLGDVGKLMLERARDLGLDVSTETILDMSPEALQQLRAVALTEVVNDAELWREDTATILVTHACFWWKGPLIPGLDTHYLKLLFDETRRRLTPGEQPVAVQETLPELKLAPPVRPEGVFYVTIVDGVYQIHRRLHETQQWRGQVPTNELILWQEQEVFLTKILADYERVPHYVVAHDEPTKTLFDLICFKRPRIYLGYPITHLRREGLWHLIEEARAFAHRLREHFVVFDPLSVKDEEAAPFARSGTAEVATPLSPGPRPAPRRSERDERRLGPDEPDVVRRALRNDPRPYDGQEGLCDLSVLHALAVPGVQCHPRLCPAAGRAEPPHAGGDPGLYGSGAAAGGLGDSGG